MSLNGGTAAGKAGALACAVGGIFAALSAALAQTPTPPPQDPERDGGSRLETDAAQGAAPSPGEREPTFSQGFEIRAFENEVSGGLDRSVGEPLSPKRQNASRRFSQELDGAAGPAGADGDEERIFDRDDERRRKTDEAPAVPGFDLFEGPSAAKPAARENQAGEPVADGRAEPLDAAAAIIEGTNEEDQDDRGTGPAGADARGLRGSAVGQPRLFAPIGPVRSPTASETSVGGRLDTALGGLRRSFPIAPDDPFAPVGIRAGQFVLYPALEQSVGTSSNLAAEPGGEAGVFSQTAVSARLLSNWSRHEAEINAAALLRHNFEGSPENEPRLDVDGRLRFDIDRDLAATLRGAFSYTRDDPILTDDLPGAGGERPEILAYSAGAELRRLVGRADFRLSGDIVREDRDDAIPPSALFSPSETFTTYSAGLRAGYDFAPLLKPFVQASVGRRFFDDDTDAGGLERASLIQALKAGLAFDLTEKLYGEVALGYAWNTPDEDAFATTRSPTVDARINWSPHRGTDVVLAAETFFDPDSSNLAASTLYQGSLAVRHRATARVDLGGRLLAGYKDADITPETTFAAESSLTYWLNRRLALTGLLRHERLDSEAPGGDYTANSVRVGLRLQR